MSVASVGNPTGPGCTYVNVGQVSLADDRDRSQDEDPVSQRFIPVKMHCAMTHKAHEHRTVCHCAAT
jgi:hypothetical protein